MAFIPTGGIVKLSQYGRLVYGEVSRDAKLVKTNKGGYFVKFSVVAGAKENGEKQYIDCKAFNTGLVNYCKDLQRGDAFCGVGDLESREYNDKTYWDLKLAWCNSPALVPDTGGEAPPKTEGTGEYDGPQFEDPDDDDEGELPF